MPRRPPLDPPAASILNLIGRTPMVEIRRLNPNPRTTIYAKLEGFNPTGSIKDRIALKMIEQAEREGDLVPGKTIVEPTSGNTGIGLAMIAAVKGYALLIVMSEAVSIERRKMIQAFGAQGDAHRGPVGHGRGHPEGAPAGARFPGQVLHAGPVLQPLQPAGPL